MLADCEDLCTARSGPGSSRSVCCACQLWLRLACWLALCCSDRSLSPAAMRALSRWGQFFGNEVPCAKSAAGCGVCQLGQFERDLLLALDRPTLEELAKVGVFQ